MLFSSITDMNDHRNLEGEPPGSWGKWLPWRLCRAWMYLAVTIVSISSHEVDSVAVFVPEGSLIRQSAVGDRDVVVVVVGGKGTSVVVGHGVTCRDTAGRHVITAAMETINK